MTTTPIRRPAGGSFTRQLARSAVGTKPDAQTIADAYVYLLGRALVVRQEHLDLNGTGADYNVIDDKPLGALDGVNPNFDVASVEAWLAVDDRTPVMLEVPEIVNRHYNVQVIDEWGGVIANINPRTFPSHPSGTFAFVTPGSRAKVPANAARIVLRSSKAKVVARVEIRQDRDGSVRLQRQFELASALIRPSCRPCHCPCSATASSSGSSSFRTRRRFSRPRSIPHPARRRCSTRCGSWRAIPNPVPGHASTWRDCSGSD